MSETKKYKRVRTPTVIQMDAVECGAASLLIILQHYGRYVPLEQLRTECGVSRDGSNALNIVKTARNYGLTSTGSKVSVEDLTSMEFPAIIWWDFNHYLVLEGFSKKKVFLNDPALGPRTVTYDEFKDSFSGLVITLKKEESFKTGGKPLSLASVIYERIKGSKKSFLYVLLIGMCLLLPGFAMPAFLLLLLEMVQTKQIFTWTSPFLMSIIFVALFTGVLTWMQKYFLSRLTLKLSIDSSSQFLWKLLRLPITFYSQRYAGEINWRLSFNNVVANLFTNYLTSAFIDLMLIFFYAIALFFYDATIASVILAIACLNIVVMRQIFRSRADALAKLRQDTSKSVAESVGGLSFIETIKARSSESDFFSRWSGYYAKRLNSEQASGIKSIIMLTTPTFLQFLATAILLCIGALHIIDGTLTMPILIAMQALMLNFLMPVNRFVGYSQLIQDMKVDLERINDVVRNPDDPIYEMREKSTADIKQLSGHLEFKNVSFRYSPLAPLLIENLSFVLKPGKRLAFVGSTGSGKTTVAKLACGIMQPESGEILYDGVPITQIPSEVFRDYVASVDQKVFLFTGSVRENLTLWNQKLPDKMIIEATQDAQIHETIIKGGEGYETQLLEGGVNFSGGQRQRMEIARALLYNPSLLILDEATSALDSHTEKNVLEKIRQRGIAALMIAHRLSTIQDCDEIIVMDRGKVAQRGTHQELKSTEGIYQALIESESIDG